MELNFVFSPAAQERFPALKGWKATYPLRAAGLTAADFAVGDLLRLQGVPAPEPLQVFMRSWTVMNDEATLMLGLTLAPSLA